LTIAACFGAAPASHAQVTDLFVSDLGGDVVLTWTTGTPPWRVIRSDSPDFYFGNRVVADGLVVAAATDPEAASSGSPSHYYRVLESGEADPPGFTANPPRPVPFITSLSPDSGKAGDLVTITGGNFESTGATMTVTFDGLLAEIVGTGESQLIVEVPEEVLTGDVSVCRAGICSNRLLFKLVVGPPFVDLSSIAFEPGTGSLWVADRGSGAEAVDSVFEIDATGAITARGILNQALLGHPSPSSGSGRIYYSNSIDSDFNIGAIEYIESASNAEVFFDNAGQSGGTSTGVRCEGIAATPLEPEVVYFLDGRADTIRRVVRDALAHDLSYGNQTFSFNSPAGARFDSAGNLYVSSTTDLYRILPQEAGVELVATGFTTASGIDLSEETGIVMLLVADEATGSIWLVNAESGNKELVGSGMTAPVGVAFSGDLATGALFYDVAEPTRIVRLPDPQVVFVEEDPIRILLSKHGTSDGYPSNWQTQDGQIPVGVTVTDKTDPAGITIYFRLVDPKDPSEYLNGQQGDNLPSTPGGSITPSAVVAADGTATAILTVDPDHAGNNYSVQASLEPPPNFKRRARTRGTYTSWRRLYIEHDRMYKQGEFLTQTSGAGQPDPARVFVASSAMFAVGDEVHVLAGDDSSTPVGQERSEGEIGIVAAVGPGFVDLQAPLALTYPAPAPDPPFPYAFLARRTGGTYDAQPSATAFAEAFDDAFTEWLLLPADGYLPHWADAASGSPSDPVQFIDARTFLFFRHFDRQAALPFTNHTQLVSAAQFEVVPPPVGAVLGRASGTNAGAAAAANWSWIFSGTIELQAPSNIRNVTNHVTAHELGHQLNVNAGSPQGNGHDEEAAWDASGSCDPANPMHCCLMFAGTPLTTSSLPKFHGGLMAPSHDLLCIRTHVDDLNQDQCPAPFPGSTP
jgi:hypothetical protein